jgi:hypothetical protein
MADEESIGSECDADMTSLKRAAIGGERYRLGPVSEVIGQKKARW